MTWSFLLTTLIVVASPGTGVLYTAGGGADPRARGRASAAAFGCTLGIVPQMIAAMLGPCRHPAHQRAWRSRR